MKITSGSYGQTKLKYFTHSNCLEKNWSKTHFAEVMDNSKENWIKRGIFSSGYVFSTTSFLVCPIVVVLQIIWRTMNFFYERLNYGFKIFQFCSTFNKSPEKELHVIRGNKIELSALYIEPLMIIGWGEHMRQFCNICMNSER